VIVRPLFRRTLAGAAVAAGLWAALCGLFYVAMVQPPERFGRIIAGIPAPLRIVMAAVPFEPLWNVARGGTLEPGDQAPDFCLARVDDADDPARECVRLSEFTGDRPVVLVFGSYT
jgi:hypothetical protein